MTSRSRIDRSLATAAHPALAIGLAATGAMLVLLQAFRVFMPYLVFEVDQSERGTLARIALTVFGLTFLGALLFRVFGGRTTLVTAAIMLIVGRLGFQFTEAPGARWRLAAATLVACLWLLIVVLPTGGEAIGFGIGFAFLIDLILRAARGTLDLPWMPGVVEHLATILIAGIVAFAAYGMLRSGALTELEAPFAPSARYVGIGSGLALWLIAAGNPGFAELYAEVALPGAFALLSIGVLVALLPGAIQARRWSSMFDTPILAVASGLLGAFAVLAWWRDWGRWLELIAMPVFAFAVTRLTMQCAKTPESLAVPGRWRTGATITIGLLLQAGFLFLYFARTGPTQLYLIPIAILTGCAALAARSSAIERGGRVVLGRAIATAGVAVLLALAWLVWDEPDTAITSAETAGLTVMTFNIQEGFSNENIWSLEETARVIERHDPDIAVLQEITRGWLVMSSADQVRWLAERLGMDYAYAGNSHDGLWGNAILSKLPILSTDSVTFSTTDNLRRSALAIEVDTADGPLLVIDTHLDNPREATDVRLQQIEELIEFWGGTAPAIIAGDFNADPGSVEWQAMIDAGLVDTGEGTTETTSEDERRIDYIFVTPDLPLSGYNVPDIWVSDHRPVLVELSLSP